MMNILVRDREAEGKLWDTHRRGTDAALQGEGKCPPPATGYSCYREVDSSNLYFDKFGNIQYDKE